MASNRIRLFADIMSVDSWHTPFQSNSREAKIHVEISFQEGRIGGDDHSLPFTFLVRLKKAVLNIKVSPPLIINRSAVARGIPEADVELVRYKGVRQKALQAIGAKGHLNPAAFFLAMSGAAKKESEVTLEDEAKVIEKVPRILVRPQPGGDREYRWELEPSYNSHLEGQPWDPVAIPRLSVRAHDTPDEPLIQVSISCKREDLEISGLRLKDECLDAKLSQAIFKEMNEAAAIQHIKHVLEFADLEPGMMDNRFSSVLLADIISAPGFEDEF